MPPRARTKVKGSARFATQSFVRKSIKNRQEMKFLTTNFSGVITDGSVILHLNPVPQGDTENERNGNRIKSQGWEYRVSTIVNDSTNLVRIIIFQDKSSNGIVPQLSNLLEGSDVLSMYDDTNVPGRFRILSDRTVTLSTNGDNQVQFIHRTGKLTSVATFNDLLTVPHQNSVFMLLISDSAISGPLTEIIARYTYTDS